MKSAGCNYYRTAVKVTRTHNGRKRSDVMWSRMMWHLAVNTLTLCWAVQLDALRGKTSSSVRLCDDRNLKPSSIFVSGLLGIFLYFPRREGASSPREVAMCDLSFFEERTRLWSDMTNHDHNKKLLLELVKRPDNSRCADCGAPGKRRSSVRPVMLKFRQWWGFIEGTLTGHRSVQFFGRWLLCKCRINLKRCDFKSSLPVTRPLL